ncbi:response regulator [Planctomycetaceae bacterium SCGC AG-212-F19]|nr:response regulator [Planctomycetaceae bacterium SCGC AG-212-F19]
MIHRIRLRGLGGELAGKVWEAETVLRAGRQIGFEIVLDDTSVSRRHAEVRNTDQGWQLFDLGSTNGTFVNGNRLATGTGSRLLRLNDVIRFGKMEVAVEILEHTHVPTDADGEQLKVEATSRASWEEAVNGVAVDRNRCPRPGEQLLALIRAGHHLGHIENDEQLLHSILNDAVAVLDAQRGAIVLAEGPANELKLRALGTGQRAEAPGRFSYSKSLSNRVFTTGESLLYTSVQADAELASAQSIAGGAMASVLCVLLRTPRRRLGILHLDRNHWQKPFTPDDLHLADALAANVSAGIECAQLLKKQRELFYNTITILAQAVELRDQYTGGHTIRVTNYSLLLAKKLGLSDKELALVRTGTPLHDIGKIGIDDAILRKPSRLSEEEFEVMKTHTTKGATILATEPELAPLIPIVRSHHERWDGKGYPDGLAGDAIHVLARMVAVADAFDAMTSDRPYRKGMEAEAAFGEVEKQSGQQFDPRCAAAFIEIRPRIVQEMVSGRLVPLDLGELTVQA